LFYEKSCIHKRAIPFPESPSEFVAEAANRYLFTTHRKPNVVSNELYLLFEEPCVLSKEPCILSKKPGGLSKEPCTSSKEPCIPSKEPFLP
jgi:hypothetical protein